MRRSRPHIALILFLGINADSATFGRPLDVGRSALYSSSELTLTQSGDARSYVVSSKSNPEDFCYSTLLLKLRAPFPYGSVGYKCSDESMMHYSHG